MGRGTPHVPTVFTGRAEIRAATEPCHRFYGLGPMASRTFDVNAEPSSTGTGGPDAADRFGQLPGFLADLIKGHMGVFGVSGSKANSHFQT